MNKHATNKQNKVSSWYCTNFVFSENKKHVKRLIKMIEDYKKIWPHGCLYSTGVKIIVNMGIVMSIENTHVSCIEQW